MGELSLTDTGVNWTAVDEAVKYDIELKSDNGTYNWYDVTATSVAINWATMFPGANVYQTWQARVKAYDHDGNYGAWSAWQTYNKPFPSVNEPAVNVYLGSDPDTHAPVSTAMKQDELFVWWQLIGAPAGFVNWNQELVTYELIVSSTNEFGVNSFKHYISNYELTGIRVNVGVLGAVTSYYFRVNTFYDGELLKEADTAAGPYIIDLKAPAAAGGLDEDISSALWRFWWTAPADADLGGYVYELQKYDAQNGKWAPAAASDSISAGTNETYVDPLMLYWSVFGQFRWRVRAFDTLGNMNEGTWAYFGYTLNDAVAPENMQYELLGEHNTLDMEEEYATATQVRFSWETPFEPVAGINMNMLFYKVELMVEEVGEGSEWITEATYLMPWTPGIMKAKFTVGESGLTKHYQGRVQAIYLSEASSDDYSEAFYIDLERPSEVVGGADYSSTMLEYPMWTFTWDDSAEDTVGIGGFLFILERLEGSTTHAIAMLDLPYIAEEEEEEPGDYDYDGIDYWFDEGTGRFVLDMDPFEFVESIDGIFRYTLIPYDNLENMGYPTEGMEFTSVWSDGDDYGTYPFINLYDNWMGEIQDMGWVNNNTYATVSFDIYGLDGYELVFTLDGVELAEGVDYMLLDAPYGSDMYYLVLLESVRDLMQGDHGSGDLEIYAYVEEEDLVVQFTVDLFGYVYENERTGFGFGRFRPAVDPGFDY